MKSARIARPVAAAVALMALASGCGEMLDTEYGLAGGRSVNGTGSLYRLFKGKGDEVRIARRYSDKVASWADTIVRFSPHPGPPDQKEGGWLQQWLSANHDHRLIYVAHDFEAQHEYWDEILRTLPADADPRSRKRIDLEKTRAAAWPLEIPPAPREPADRNEWFAVDASARSPATCKSLEGPWAAGVVAEKAALTRRQTIALDAETLLLSGDGKALVVSYTWTSGSQILIVANGSFLLNEPLARASRRALAMRVVNWPGEESRRVAFVEGPASTDKSMHAPSMFDLLFVDPLGWIGGHLIALGLIGGLAAAVRLGRARGEPPSGADRPVAHAEALGGLLSRTRDMASALAELETYRRWRHPASNPARPAPTRPRSSESPTESVPEGRR